MILGIAGPKNSGKDTLANALNIYNNHPFVIRPFADPVKRVCQQLYLLSDEQLYDREAKERVDTRWGLSPRQMFQQFGTDYVRRQLSPDFWLKHFELWYYRQPAGTSVLVPDVRFQNEVDLIHKLGGRVVYVYRPFEDEEEDLHESELNSTQLQHIDFTVNNCGTLEKYYATIADFNRQLF